MYMWASGYVEGKLFPVGRNLLFLGTVGLLGGLLLLVLVSLVAGRAGQGALQDLENLLILDLLVGLVLGEVGSVGCGQAGDTVLGDGCNVLVPSRTQTGCLNRAIIPRVVNRRETGAFSESPAGSYCLNTPLRTHSTTPTLAAFSSSSWRKLKGN